MQNVVMATLVALVLSTGFAAPVAARNYEAGKDAYECSYYATAPHNWLRLAAQGDASAQVHLGLMYVKGIFVPLDYAQAYMWINLAANQGSAFGLHLREWLEGMMTLMQIVEAVKLARECKP